MLRDLSKKTDISTVQWASREIHEFSDSLLTVFSYNGYEYYLDVIRDYINEVKDKEKYSIQYPEHILKGETDSIANILWSTLVVMFGEYGTSPRFGWIEKKRVCECLYFLDWFIELFEDKEDDE